MPRLSQGIFHPARVIRWFRQFCVSKNGEDLSDELCYIDGVEGDKLKTTQSSKLKILLRQQICSCSFAGLCRGYFGDWFRFGHGNVKPLVLFCLMFLMTMWQSARNASSQLLQWEMSRPTASLQAMTSAEPEVEEAPTNLGSCCSWESWKVWLWGVVVLLVGGSFWTGKTQNLHCSTGTRSSLESEVGRSPRLRWWLWKARGQCLHVENGQSHEIPPVLEIAKKRKCYVLVQFCFWNFVQILHTQIFKVTWSNSL